MVNSDLRGKLVVPDEVSCRIDKFLAKELSISRSRIQRNIDSGLITLNGEKIRSNRVIKPGDVIEYQIPPSQTPSLVPEAIPLTIRYEDEHLVVIDKAPGMVVHPAPGSPDGTLVNALLHRYKDLSFPAEDTRPGIVHRLDKDTSGLILVARNEEIKAKLAKAIMKREVKRTYMTLTLGHLKVREGIIDSPIGRHPADRKKMATFGINQREARTSYRVLESYDACELVEVNLLTGRTHQIRVHFSSIGHSVVGDSVYRGGKGSEGGVSGDNREKVRKLLSMIDRQALHAYRLEFNHPVTGESITIESELPPDFSRILDFLRSSEV